MMIRGNWVRGLATAAVVVTLAACAAKPVVHTQSAPAQEIQKYQTFGFVEKPDTDKPGYTTLNTRYLKDAVTREMTARGYSPAADNPDLVVNFALGSKDKVEGDTGPTFGVGIGRGGWGRGGWGWGGSYGGVYSGRDIRTITEGSLTIDVVDPQKKELKWSGTAKGRVTSKSENNSQQAIDEAVAAIFAKYPKQPLVADTPKK